MIAQDLASSARRGAGFPWGDAWGPQRHYPNIIIIWDGRICMFAVLLLYVKFALSFVHKVYIGFLHVSCMRDWTVGVAQYSKFTC
jgi:hypothetical protein